MHVRTHFKDEGDGIMKNRKRNPKESGQAALLVLLALAIFLLGTLAFAVDMGFQWWHRQTAQSAADAACIAGAMDLLVYNQSPNASTLYPWIKGGTGFDCKGQSNPSVKTNPGPCQYAARNGYDSGGTTPGNDVYVSFPTSLPSVATAPPSTLAPVPFMRVDVLDHVQTFFWGLLGGKTSSDVRAFAKCGAVQVNAPVPILVLAPTGSGTFQLTGGGTVNIAGGPSQSIQVNSSESGAVVSGAGSGVINLQQAGPNNNGADFGVWGGTASAPANLQCGSADTNCWKSGDPPINDPFAGVSQPACGVAIPAAGWTGSCTTAATVTYGVTGAAATSWGCPDPSTGKGCDHYTPGYYPNGITIKKGKDVNNNNNSAATGLALFDAGLYYLAGSTGFQADTGSCLRPSTVNTGTLGGTIFYLAGSGTLNITANSGTTNGNGNPCASASIVAFNATSGGATGFGLKCASGSVIPGNLPGSFTGNVLLAPCAGPYGDQTLASTGSVDPKLGQQRGMLFFQNHVSSGVQPLLSGGGTYISAGDLYFHATNYSDILTLKGGTAASTYTFGDIVTDKLWATGGGTIVMDLNTSVTFGILKATLLQ
jgi:putative Flp pilus-assembly TadE/G-like protein